MCMCVCEGVCVRVSVCVGGNECPYPQSCVSRRQSLGNLERREGEGEKGEEKERLKEKRRGEGKEGRKNCVEL